MAFPCPYCQHSISVKSAKAGRYKPKCPKCVRQFLLVVPTDGEPTPQAIDDDTLQEDPGTVRAAKAADATVKVPAKPKPTAPEKTGDFSLPPADATGVFHHTPDAAADASDATGVFTTPPAPVAEDPSHKSAKTKVGEDKDDVGEFSVDPPPKPKKPKAEAITDMPESMGGYRIVKELGRGGMGAVYMAQQTSLDRPVALKVMNVEWSKDPGFVARFTREAYAAAQLTHHNIIQIYDFGTHHDVHYFSMEYVEGESLGDMLKRAGKLDVEQAVGFTLQAARGLKHAHDRGMVHRDIKPDNLMLNTQGIIKVADLGLVKTPGVSQDVSDDTAVPKNKVAKGSRLADATISDVTRVGSAMGTPAYMSPEQARNASAVDQRADVYSLGCTLYVLLTGRPPFQGSTVMEIFSKHASEPLVPPDAIVKRVPKEISTIIQKMVAKKPDDRFEDMAKVAKALEEWLGERSGGGVHDMTEEQVSKLEDCVKQFNGVKLAPLRMLTRVAIVGGSLIFAFLFLLLTWLSLSFGAVMFAAETALTAFVIGGIFSPSPLFLKVREYVLGSRWTIWVRLAISILVFLGLIILFGWQWIWLVVTILAIAAGAGIYFGLDRTVDAQRQPSLQAAEEILKQLRLRGMDEEEVRNFVCKYGGNSWEEFYEELFGFEEKLKARDWWVRGQKGQARQKYAAWREPIISALDARIQARKAAADQRKLQRLEEERLKAEGMSASDARDKAAVAAERLVDCAKEMRKDEAGYGVAAADEAPRKPKKIAAMMLQDIEKSDEAPVRRPPSTARILSQILNLVMGPTLRLLLGALLLGGCVLWMYQNGLIKEAQNIQGVDDAWKLAKAPDAHELSISFVPSFLTKWFNGYGAALAGFMMLISAFLPNWKAAILMPIAAAIAWLGPALGVPDIAVITGAQLSMAIGGAIGLLAIVLGRKS